MSPELKKLAWDTAQAIMCDTSGRISSTVMAEHIEAAFRQVVEMAAERVNRLRPNNLTGRGDYDCGHAHGLLNAEESVRAMYKENKE